ncbi:hypothetical protein CANDROIZ_100020 [Candidatus Roizmanbacteria bacterium]|mgnify:FL=1|nr:hypothetical protein CANDROIZ_100020 [Candidatus Roizmanbacteria bacterium]
MSILEQTKHTKHTLEQKSMAGLVVELMRLNLWVRGIYGLHLKDVNLLRRIAKGKGVHSSLKPKS